MNDFRQNVQPTKELTYFQKLIVQEKYIKWLNGACDYWQWECEKRDTIIEMRDEQIAQLGKEIATLHEQRIKVEAEFKEYLKTRKQIKLDQEKMEKQQALIEQLKSEKHSLNERLQTRDRMVKLLQKQQNGGRR